VSIALSVGLFVVGLVLVLFSAERLVKGVVGTSLGFGVSAFLVSVVFIGFDPENLAVGAAGAFEGIAGIALGSVVGAAMVAIGLAFGVTALVAPMRFGQVSRQVLAVPLLAVLLLGLLGTDGRLSRGDGTILLVGFGLAVLYLVRLSRRGLDIQPTGEVAETLEEAETLSRWHAFGLLLLSLAGIIVGSEMLVRGAGTIILHFGLSDTLFGMTVLAFLVSIEELARELPAALRGRPEITFGNVVGSILAFFLFNAGIIALVRPVVVDPQVLRFYLPVCFVTLGVISLFMMARQVPRWAGGLLVLLYLVFVVGGAV
jgi:cation:H+ antiporter